MVPAGACLRTVRGAGPAGTDGTSKAGPARGTGAGYSPALPVWPASVFSTDKVAHRSVLRGWNSRCGGAPPPQPRACSKPHVALRPPVHTLQRRALAVYGQPMEFYRTQVQIYLML